MQGSNALSESLLKMITNEGLLFLVPGQIDGCYFIRFAVCAASTERRHIDFAYEVIAKHTQLVFTRHTQTQA